MGNSKDVGVTQKSNGYWEYRFAIVVDGKTISKRKSTDEFGNKLLTKRAAIKAREKAMVYAREERRKKHTIPRKKVKEIYWEFIIVLPLSDGRSSPKFFYFFSLELPVPYIHIILYPLDEHVVLMVLVFLFRTIIMWYTLS